MATTASQERPDLPTDVVMHWPEPEQLPHTYDWGSMSVDERRQWLLERTYERTDAGWVPRANRSDDETAQQVLQAVQTADGISTFTEVLFPKQFGWWLLVLMIMLVLVTTALITDMFGLTAESSDHAAVVADVIADEAVPDAGDDATHLDQDDGASDGPVELTDGPWRFFNSPSADATAIWDIQFEPGGSCFVPSAVTVHTCEYVVTGDDVLITLYTTWDPGQVDCPAEIETTSWFDMTREGDEMLGIWEMEDLEYSCEDGLIGRGTTREHVPAVYAVPRSAVDPG